MCLWTEPSFTSIFTDPSPPGPGSRMLDWLQTSAWVSAQGDLLVDDPRDADAILFFSGHAGADALKFGALFHPLYRRYRDKCFLYHDGDFAVPILPGIYPSLLVVDHRPGWAEGFPYYARQAVNQAVTEAVGRDPARQWIASFMRARNCAVRERLLDQSDPRALHQDTTGRHAWRLSPEERRRYEGDYAEACATSRFILAPRGIGPSTYRQYEAWEMGRCPVILSDDWVPPPEIPYETAAIRCPEAEVSDLPLLLNRLEGEDDRERGRAGREIYDRWLTQEAAFPYIHRTLARLRESGAGPISRSEAVRRIAGSPYRRIFAGSIRRMIRDRAWRSL